MNKLRLFSVLMFVTVGALVARAEDRVIVDDFDERPVQVKNHQPAYPRELMNERVSGVVNMWLVIDKNGSVVEREIAKSSRLEFEMPALEAVRKWRFKPAKKSGVPVMVRILVPVQFTYKA